MGVERQVIAGHGEPPFEGDPQALSHLLAQRPRMEIPEQAVVNEQQLRAGVRGRLEQLAVG